MRFCQLLFQTVTDFIRFALTFINVITQCFFAFTVTDLTSTVNHCQRTLDMVVAELHTAFTLIRHVAIGTRDTSLTVNTHLSNFVIRMLCFQDRGTAQFMNIIIKTGFIIIGFHIFHSKAFIPRESQVFAVTLEVIFYVTLRTYERTHFLWSSLCDILALTLERFNQSRTADMKIHRFRIVAIGTTDRVHNFRTHGAPLIVIERINAQCFHHTGNIRALAGPASRRLRTVGRIHRCSGTKRSRDIFDSMHMSARSGIIFRESISRPKYYHIRTLFQYINSNISIKLTLEICFCSFRPSLIFTREIILKEFVACFNPFDDSLAIIKDTSYFRPPLH